MKKLIITILTIVLCSFSVLAIVGHPAAQIFPGLFATGNYTFGTNVLFIDDTNDRVGIGTTSPDKTMHVVSSTVLNTTTGNGYGTLYLQGITNIGEGNYGPSIEFSGVGRPANRQAAIASVQTGADPDHTGLAFFTHGTSTATDLLMEKMRIDVGGNVGIGTTSPETKLEASGVITASKMGRFKGWLGGGETGAAAEIGFSGGTGWLGTYNRSSSLYLPLRILSSTVQIDGNSGNGLYVDSTSNVGIGTTNPLKPLHIQSSTGGADMLITATDSEAGIHIDADSPTGAPVIRFLRQGSTLWGIFGGYPGNTFAIYDYGATGGTGSRLTIDDSGNVIISDLAGGSDRDYVCVETTGELVRSPTAC